MRPNFLFAARTRRSSRWYPVVHGVLNGVTTETAFLRSGKGYRNCRRSLLMACKVARASAIVCRSSLLSLLHSNASRRIRMAASATSTCLKSFDVFFSCSAASYSRCHEEGFRDFDEKELEPTIRLSEEKTIYSSARDPIGPYPWMQQRKSTSANLCDIAR
jgi:hypothetical protein